MSITIFGIFFFIVTFVIFLNNNAKMMFGLLVFSMCAQSVSVVRLEEKGVGPQVFASILFSVWILLNSRVLLEGKLVIKHKEKYWRVATLSVWLFFGYIAYSVYQREWVEITDFFYVFQLLAYIICFFSIPYITRRLEEDEADAVIEGVILIIAVIGVVQFLTTTNVLSKNVLLETFVYDTSLSDLAYNIDFYPRVFSTFMEPSYCAPFLVGGFYYLISRERWNRKSLALVVLLAAEIVLTMSSTAYGATILTGAVYLLASRNKKALKFLIPLAAVMMLFLSIMGTMQNILNDVIFNKLNTSSGITRNGWDMQAWDAFLENPLFGAGYRMVRGSQFYTSVLGQIGMVGTALYALSVLPLLLAGLRRKESVPASMFLTGSIVAQAIAIPDLDFCVFWLSMYLVRMATAYSRQHI